MTSVCIVISKSFLKQSIKLPDVSRPVKVHKCVGNLAARAEITPILVTGGSNKATVAGTNVLFNGN